MRSPIPFGPHLLLERINVGGMAEVFRAKSFGVEGFERIVAIKRILPQMAEDEEFIKMFKDEARIASQLGHQNIVQIYELGKEAEIYYIAMEFVAGRDLRLLLDRFKRQRRLMSEGMACFLISRVCEALDYAHRKKDPSGKPYKIIHRDVSPQNVIVSFEGEVKLCDFGIAKAVTQSTRTQAGVLKGKFAYMSPEQVKGKPIDRRSDLFALGVIFYEMLTGERLFLGESDFSTLEAVRAGRIPNPRKHNKDLPKRLEQILMKILAKNPDRRYQWASEVHEDLHEYLAQTGQIYHAHHLRQFMQEAYAREISIENEKLEAFMKVKRPPEREEDEEPAVPHEAPIASLRGSSRARRIRSHSLAKARHPEPKTDAAIEDSVPPTFETFGEENATSTHDARLDLDHPPTIEQRGSPIEDDEPLTGEMGEMGDENPTMMLDEVKHGHRPTSSDGRTVSGEGSDQLQTRSSRLEDEIKAAQAELLERLDAEGAIGEGDTVDAQITDGEISNVPSIIPAQDENGTLIGDSSTPDPEDFALLQENLTAGNETFVAPDERDNSEEAFGQGVDWAAFSAAQDAADDPPTVGQARPASMARRVATNPPGRRRRIREKTRHPGSHRVRSVPPGQSSAPPPYAPAASPYSPAPADTPPPRNWASEMPPVEVTGQASLQPRSLSDPRVMMGLASVLGAIALVIFAIVFSRGRSRTASLEITTTPVTDVRVMFDGKLVADRTPVSLDEIGIGKHAVKIVAKGYETYEQEFEIGEARPHTLPIPLEKKAAVAPKVEEKPPEEPPPPKTWTLRVSSVPNGGTVTIDGTVIGATPLEQEGLQMDAKMRVMVEYDGYQPARRLVRPPNEAGDTVKVNLRLRKNRTRAPAPKPETTRRKPFVTGSNDEPADPPKAKPPKAAAASAEQGLLLIRTTPPGAAVIIDGRRTNLRTPVRRPYPLKAGRHRITLVGPSGRAQDYVVNIRPGAPFTLNKRVR